MLGGIIIERLPFSPPNILILDDVSANLVVLTEIIRNAGYIARPVTNAKQAVNAIEAMPPSLILMDVSMPDIDGYTFCSMLKKNASTREIPIIFISAHSSTEAKIKGFKAGAVDYITKPFESEEIALRIKVFLKLYKDKNDLEENNMRLYTVINDQVKKLYETQKHVVNALVKLVLQKDAEKAEHFELVAKNSKILAIGLQLSSKYKNVVTSSFVDAIELTAPLLDVGKTVIRYVNLQNSCDILCEDSEFMKTHTLVGAALLENIYKMNAQNEFLKLAIDIARYHHENWDGTGYPRGLNGIEIPLSARIVSIINTYNLLVSCKDYGLAYNHNMAMDFINKKSGIYFDPDITNIFNKIKNQLKH